MGVDNYRARAITAAQTATVALAEIGVTAVVIGSLAKGNFAAHSDIDLLITVCPRDLKYSIEGMVEDAMEGFSFDVVYLDEVSAWRLQRFTAGAIHASELR